MRYITVMRVFVCFAMMIAGSVMIVPRAYGAASVSAILSAVGAAQQASLCTEDRTSYGSDCVKTVIRCDSVKGQIGWASLISSQYENAGGTVVAASGFEGPYGALEYLRADWDRNSDTPPGPIEKGTCYCSCGANTNHEGCNGKPAGFAFRIAEDLTYDECSAQCAPEQINPKCAGSLASLRPPDTAAAAQQGAALSLSALCFTPTECTEQDGVFEEHADCPGRGRCYALEPEIKLNQPFGGVTHIRGLGQYVVTAYRYALATGAIVATVMFVFGAFKYLLGSALHSIKKGKETMVDAVFGLILLFAATFLLRTVNPATTNLNPLKTYLVNSSQYNSTDWCSGLTDATRLAEAGTRPALTPFASVAGKPESFSVRPVDAQCGKTYWMSSTAGNSCEGSACPDPAEACVSCADGEGPGCLGIPNDRRICTRVVFAGTIDFSDSRYPTGVSLLAFCNFAQSPEADAVYRAVFPIERATPSKVGRRVGAVTTDESDTGRASYHFDYTANSIAEAVESCKDFGGLRGAVLGVVYKESFSSTGFTVDDVAVLSRSNCGRGMFDGYADGTRTDFSGDLTDEAAAIACGVRQGKFQSGAGTFWTLQDLLAAAEGRKPITCDFGLTGTNAPENPAASQCAQGSGVSTFALNCRNGSSCVTIGGSCQSDTEVCDCVEEPATTLQTIGSVLVGGVAGLAADHGVLRNCRPKAP
ncbi:MAG: hypothetical protein RL141_46 [Candidatus Parcubacteria bacterium]|jgi:hypothetical protein